MGMMGMMRTAVLMVCLAVIAFALLTAPEGKPDFHFRERMLVSWASALALLATGVLLLGAARARERAAGRWLFWEVAGWGFVYLAFDEHFQFHERAGALAERSLGPASLVNHLDDAVIMAYGLAAAILCWLHRDEVRRLLSRPLPLALASTCLVGTVSVDAFGPDTPPYRAIEESLKLLAGTGFLLWAYESRAQARELSALSPRP